MTRIADSQLLLAEGFTLLGRISHRIVVEAWWHAVGKIQVLSVPTDRAVLLRGTKSYFLRSISEEGETWARDIPQLQKYLESHFPELRLSFSFFRDISPALAKAHIGRRIAATTPTVRIPDRSLLECLQQELEQRRGLIQARQSVLQHETGSSRLAESYLKRQLHGLQQGIQELERKVAEEQKRVALLERLQHEYLRDASAASLVFSVSSNVHFAGTDDELRDGLRSVMKELADTHRYQVAQKLGGRLNIRIAEADQPELAWIEEWFGGALSPRDVAKLWAGLEQLQAGAEEHLAITPNCDIRRDGHVWEDQKHLGAQIASTLLGRLDRTGAQEQEHRSPSPAALPLRLGWLVEGNRVTSTPCEVPLASLEHCYCSGSTGSGKSYFGRVLLEEASRFAVDVLVLDPRNQAFGLRMPEDRPEVLGLYPEFGMEACAARGFDFTYHAPGQAFGEKLPSDLGELARGKRIVCLKGLDDRERCLLFAQILDAVFDACAAEESASPRLVVFVEEAARFTKKRVAEDAKSAGERAEVALDRTVREGRKYGCCVVILSQSIKDFSHDAASIRQNTNTKVFLRNSDREIDYAAQLLGDGKQIVQLPPGTALIHHGSWGVLKVRVRPPLSKVWEFSAEETRRLVAAPAVMANVSGEAVRLLEIVRRHLAETGQFLNVSGAGDRLAITSKRRLQELIDELEQAGLVRTKRLAERGQPRVIEPIPSGGGPNHGQKPDGSGRNP